MVFPRQNLTKWDAVFCKKNTFSTCFVSPEKKLKSISTFKAPKIDFLWRVVDFPGLGFCQNEPQTGIIEMCPQVVGENSHFGRGKGKKLSWNFFRTHETCWECVFCKKRHLIWSSFAQGTPFIIYTPVYELPILCYISNPDIKEI